MPAPRRIPLDRRVCVVREDRNHLRPERAQLSLVLCLIFAGIAVACGNGKLATDEAASPATSDRTFDGEACETLAQSQVSNLFDALNGGEAGSIERMFPERDDGWRFQVSPDITEAARWAKEHSLRDITGQSGLSDVPSSDATSRSEIRHVVDRFSNLTVTMRAVDGRTLVDEFPSSASYGHNVFSAELGWEATGQALYDRGWRSMEGGGKVMVDCETRLFTVVLMSPLTFAPAG